MLGSSLLRVAGAAPRLAGPRCQTARQLSSQASRALTSLVTPSKARWQEPQPQRSSRGRAYAGFAGHEAGFKSATCKEVGEEVTKGAVKYLDVRTPEEFQAGHAPGASNVPVWLKAGGGMQPNPDFLSTVEAQFADKGTPLIVGCKSGKRSEVACDMMTKAGFSGLTNLLGGFDAWAAEGLPVEK